MLKLKKTLGIWFCFFIVFPQIFDVAACIIHILNCVLHIHRFDMTLISCKLNILHCCQIEMWIYHTVCKSNFLIWVGYWRDIYPIHIRNYYCVFGLFMVKICCCCVRYFWTCPADIHSHYSLVFLFNATICRSLDGN